MRTLLLILTASCATAAEVSVTADYVSRYTFRGDALAGRSLQPAMNVQLEPFYVGAWINQPLSRHEEREIDFTGGWAHKALDAGVTAYTYPEGGKTTYEPYVGLSHEMPWIKSSVYAFRDVTLNVTAFEAKVSTTAVISKTLDAVVDGAFGCTRDTSYWLVGPALRYKTDKITFSVGTQRTDSGWVWRVGGVVRF